MFREFIHLDATLMPAERTDLRLERTSLRAVHVQQELAAMASSAAWQSGVTWVEGSAV